MNIKGQLDCNFPLIKYDKNKSYKEWGESHGESWKEAIRELVEIRTHLMLTKSPHLKNHLDDLASKQLNVTKAYAPHLLDEMLGIARGAGITDTQIIILNNYTDFRDITLHDQGCSTLHIQTGDATLSGQTWDMHASAKRFLATIHVPANEYHNEMMMLSLVGCLGLMGITTSGLLVGVNNINTQKAQAALVWPVLVRKLLQHKNLQEVENELYRAPVTSGHNYLVSDPNNGAHFEITPTTREKVLSSENQKRIFHTNHCLGVEAQKIEDKLASNSTTLIRYELIEKKINSVATIDDFYRLLTDHENYPKSICSHFASGAQDPSFTCGGGVADLTQMQFSFWRGCPHEDKNFFKRDFKLQNNEFIQL